jgi:hypothetical protein
MSRRCMPSIALSSIAVASMIFAAPANAAGDTVRYEVQSNARLNTVTYFDYIGDIGQDTSPAGSSWSLTFQNVADYSFYSVSAQTNGTQVACQLYVNGALVDSNTSTGKYTIVDCKE